VKLHIDIEATCGAARVGRVHTARGSFETPIFMPVGTRGAVRAMTSGEMERLGAEIILGNTYHLMLRPGADVVEDLGGLHAFMGWSRHTLTDSGGFQVFSLGPKITDDGATFRSTYDGDTVHLTPEDAVRIQEQLGADIQMVLDVCAPLPSDRRVLEVAVRRTADWAARAKASHRRVEDQSLFGIVQGGDDVALRVESAERTVELDFDGYAVGGLSVGESRERMLPALGAALDHLPADQPRYFMGLGDPVGIIEAVALGVDMMDCVMPTRFGRHGTMITSEGRFNIKRQEFARSTDPIDPECSCETCTTYSRGYLRHLVATGEPTAPVLCTIHNLAWLFGFVDKIRASIRVGDLDRLRAETREVWGAS
jgi:queuine tRNA-ribosyltransferase